MMRTEVTRDTAPRLEGREGAVEMFTRLRAELWPGAGEEIWEASIRIQTTKFLEYIRPNALIVLVEAALREHHRAGYAPPKSIGHISREIRTRFGVHPISVPQAR
jgi:hypothetical protein